MPMLLLALNVVAALAHSAVGALPPHHPQHIRQAAVRPGRSRRRLHSAAADHPGIRTPEQLASLATAGIDSFTFSPAIARALGRCGSAGSGPDAATSCASTPKKPLDVSMGQRPVASVISVTPIAQTSQPNP